MKKVAIIGGGASSLIIADYLSSSFQVTIYEKEKTIGRKFLVAGKGGFNLTNEVEGKELLDKYTPQGLLDEALIQFDSNATRAWLDSHHIPTFIGSSGRIFPEKQIKPIQVLEAIRQNLLSRNVQIKTHHTFVGFNHKKQVVIKSQVDKFPLDDTIVVFALGGSSWSQTGSDGYWTTFFNDIDVKCNPFQSSNCGINISWNKELIKHHAGKPLKNISITTDGVSIKGEALLTDYGLEGNVIYPSVPTIRNALDKEGETYISIDFKPNNSVEQLFAKVTKETTTKSYEKVFHLNKIEMAILKSFTSKEEFCDAASFVRKIKSLQLPVQSLRSIDEAISTVGGIDSKNLNIDFSLKKIPNCYIAGEMIDWDAPTGGFLLQGCFSIGYSIAQSILSVSRGAP
jgi:uncharacterized flavoprotein (TIGR03862 family)